MRAGRGAAAAVAAAALAAALAAAAVFGLDAAAGQAAEHAAEPPPAHPWGSAGGGAGHGGASAPYWRFLGGVAAGDSFTYRICDALYGPLAPRRVGSGGDGGGWACYLAGLRIEAVVPVSGGRGAAGGADVYVVGAAADWEGGGAAGIGGGAPSHRPDAVLLVIDGGDGRLAVRHALPADRALAESLQRTVFWRGGLGGGVELAYGAPAAELIRGVPSTALLVSGSHVSAGGLVVYTASHGLPRPAPYAEGGWRAHAGQGISKVALAAGVGLPVSARVYGGAPPPLDHYHPGRPLFEYEMVSIGRAPDAAHAQPAGNTSAHADQISNPHYPVHGGLGRGPPSGRGDGGW